jgi:hypothetical protein
MTHGHVSEPGSPRTHNKKRNLHKLIVEYRQSGTGRVDLFDQSSENVRDREFSVLSALDLARTCWFIGEPQAIVGLVTSAVLILRNSRALDEEREKKNERV